MMDHAQWKLKSGEAAYSAGKYATGKRPWFGRLPEREGGDFAFAVVGDRCGMATEGVFERALGLLADLRPEFVLSVGDLIEGYWKDALSTHEEWDEIDAMLETAGLPFFHAMGNHDCGNQTMFEVWQARKGFDYYAFRHGDALFAVLNTEDPPHPLSDALVDLIKAATDNVRREPERAQEHMKAFYAEVVAQLPPEELSALGRVDIGIGAGQMTFFERVLAENRDVKWTFVVMHKPGWKADNPAYARLEQLLADRPHTVFAGHFHAMEYTKTGAAAERIQVGRTGGGAHGAAPCDENLVLWVAFKNGVPSYRVLGLDGIGEVGNYPRNEKKHA